MNSSMPASADRKQGEHRCFYAIKFSPKVADYLLSLIRDLKRHDADVRWTREENLHLTLRFLGEINDGQLAQAGKLPAMLQPEGGFQLGAQGLGAFPSLRNASVLWAGVQGRERSDTDALLRLQTRTEEWAQQLGLPPERRRYSPHITLGRVRRPGPGLRSLINELTVRDCDSGFCSFGELVLMRSTLGGDGAHYDVVGRWTI
jgi:RNA 2',3'-cyclic 3'-phosphodiesterase